MTILDQGLELMLYGMATVFVFLTLLVGAMLLMSAFITRFMSEPAVSATASAAVGQGAAVHANSAVGHTVDPKIVAAIHAAIQLHRARD